MMTDTYQPKHMKRHKRGRSGHCCFAGCTPMGCPGGCCVKQMGHGAGCPMNQFRQWEEEDHARYVDSGQRKHLALPAAPPPTDARKRCACGSPKSITAQGCGPSGCINVPA